MSRKKWTEEKLKAEAKKYNTRGQFKLGSPSAYVIARKSKILDTICKHMKTKSTKERNYWTEERILEEALKYQSREEFRKGSSSAYSAAGKLKIKDKVCAHMEKNLWTEERILKEVKKYKTYNQFMNESQSAYQASGKLKIRDKIKKLLPMTKNENGYWSLERLKKEARKYNNKTEFLNGNKAAYSAARKHKKKDEILAHMPDRKKTKTIIWDEGKIRELAKNLDNRTTFQKKYSAAARMAKKLGIYDEVTSHMEYKVKPNNTWTEEMVLKISSQYNTRGEFQKHASDAYLAARRLDIMDKATKHMKRVGNRHKRAIYAFEFEDKSVYVGLTYNYDKRYDAHMKGTQRIIDKTNEMGHEFIMFNEYFDMETASKKEAEKIAEYESKGWEILNKAKAGALGGNIRKWTKKAVLEEALKYNSIAEFNSANPSAYSAALNLGLKNEIKSHMTNLRRPDGYWTKERVLKEAKKYNTKSEFHKNAPSAFAYSKKLGIRDECYQHMKKPSRTQKWTKDKIIEEALKYNSRSDFQKGSRGAYKAANAQGIRDEVCAHMEYKVKPNGTWTKNKIKKEAKKYKLRSHFKKNAGSAYQAAKRLNILDEVCSHMSKDGRKNKK